ncbi:MAG: hypothetical protein ACLRSW_02345 [Christensenellaceae bacterium]
MLDNYEEHTDKVWETNIFGKTSASWFRRSAGKMGAMPPDIRKRCAAQSRASSTRQRRSDLHTPLKKAGKE